MNKTLIAAGITIAFSAMAQAEMTTSQTRSFEPAQEVSSFPKGFYITGGLGYATVNVDEASISEGLDQSGVTLNDTTNNRAGFSIWTGVDFTDYLAVEVGYLDFGETSVEISGSVTDKEALFDAVADNLPLSASGFAIALKPSVNISDDVRLFARLGAMQWSGDKTIAGITENVSDLSMLYGAGVSLDLSRQWQVQLGWDRVTFEKEPTDMATLSLSYRFGAYSNPVVYTPQPTINIDNRVQFDMAELYSAMDKYNDDANQRVLQAEEARKASLITEMNFLFAVESELTERVNASEVDQIIEVLNDNPESQLTLTGFTDPTGTQHKNENLAERRASSVADYFVRRGGDMSRVIISSAADIGSDTEKSHADQRRVEGRIINL